MKRYEGERIEVTYDTARCLHAAECMRGLPPSSRVPTRVRLPEGGPILLGKSANEHYCDQSGPCGQWKYEPS